jgi:exonuclease SbcC
VRVEEVRLENIRSHVESTIPFAEGFNCLIGGLGSGKSSILYAIDFSLLGDPLGRSYDYLLREEANKGKITLKFISGGKTYTITRTLRRQGKNISQDMDQLKLFEGEHVVASGKNEAVLEQLKAITDLDKDLFREIVWVRQEHLKELLDVTPRQRQKRLDELFGLSDYEEAWINLQRYQRDYKVERDVLERDEDVVGFERLQDNYNQAVEDFVSVEYTLGTLQKELVQAESTLKEATSRLESLEELRTTTEELSKKQAAFRANFTNVEDACANLANQIEQKKKIINDIDARLQSMNEQEESYRKRLLEAGLNPEQPIQQLREYESDVEDQMVTLRGEQESNRREIDSFQKRISTLKTESKCPFCLQTLGEGYRNEFLKRLQDEATEREKKQKEILQNLKDLEKTKEVVDLVDSNLRILTPRIEETRKRISSEHESLNKLLDEFGGKQKQEKMLRRQLSAISDEIAKFDVAELESVRQLREKAFSNYSKLTNKLEVLEARKKDLSIRVDEIKERLDQAQEKTERIEKIKQLLEVIEVIRGAYRSIQPRLRGEFIKYLEQTVQHFLNGLIGVAGPILTVKIDETYTPIIKSEDGYERDAATISGGERTLLAFAYRIGLGQLIMQSRTGHGLFMLLLDEPTESLGREDGSVDRLAEAISRLKSIEQIIAVTHSEAFAEKAEHVIRLEKAAEASSISLER